MSYKLHPNFSKVSLEGFQKASLKKASTLFKIAQLLDESQIPFLTFKGHALSISLYQNAHQRMFSDLDFLLRKEDLSRACQLLLENGFHSYLPLPKAPDFYEAIRFEKDIALWNPDKSFLIELHFKLAHEMDSTWDEVWATRKQIDFDGRLLHTLSDDINLVYLCAHGHRHGWERLDWLFDFAEAYKRTTRAMSLFQRFNMIPELKIALRLCHFHFGMEIPQPLQKVSPLKIRQALHLQKLRAENKRAPMSLKIKFWMSCSLKRNLRLFLKIKNRYYRSWILEGRPLYSYHLWRLVKQRSL